MNLYIATLPEVFGYGYTAFSQISPDHARAKIHAHYKVDFEERNGFAPRDHKPQENFNDVFEYYGGRMKKLDIQTVYCTELDLEYLPLEDKELCAEEREEKGI